MLAKLIPVIFLILGTGAGVGAGIFLAPPDNSEAEPHETPPKEPAADSHGNQEQAAATEFVKLNNQFVVPIIKNERVASLVVASMSVEVQSGTTDRVFEREPKLRDSFLRVLFDHSNMGGFDGDFIQSDMLDVLRRSLKEAARKEIGDDMVDVLITDIARQDS
ncbi:flagellar basal body-associated FliL family protein [Rhodobacteraceae bacterium F11138]|nr:flagellar basal body-associated FliL family protein [Rhodobacteraceae bacterium F11138]